MIVEILLYLSLMFFALGQLGRVSFAGQQVNIYPFEIVLSINLILLFFRYGWSPIRENYQKYRVIFIFFLWLLSSYAVGLVKFSLMENAIGFLYLIRLGVYFMYFFYVNHHLTANKNLRKKMVTALTACGIAVLLISVLQYFLYPDLRNLLYLGWDPHLYRIFGLFFDPATTAAVFGLFFFFFLSNRRYVLSGLFFLAVIMTFSRMGYAAFLVSFLLFLVKKQRYGLMLGMVFLFLLIVISVPKPWGEGVNLARVYSLQSRWQDYKNASEIWKKNPIEGVGYNRIRYMKQRFQFIDGKTAGITHAGASFHSSFLIILVSGGLIGLILFAGILYKLGSLNEAATMSVIFLTLSSLGDNVILNAFILFLFFQMIFVSIPLSDRRR